MEIQKPKNVSDIKKPSNTPPIKPEGADDILFDEGGMSVIDTDTVQIQKAKSVETPPPVAPTSEAKSISEAEAIKQGYTCIKSGEDLMKFINENPNGKYILMCDIDFSKFDFQTMGKTQAEAFNGVFEGNGYKMKNLNKSLFDFTGSNAVINNVNLEDIKITTPSLSENGDPQIASCGALVGKMSLGTISNCKVSGSINLQYPPGNVIGKGIGGLVANNNGTIKNCSADNLTINTPSASNVGGIAGSTDNGSITGCSFNGSLSGNWDVGGIVGVMYSGAEISDCKSTGTIKGNQRVGGIAGFSLCFKSLGVYDGIIQNCSSDADINGDIDVGGIIGLAQHKSTLNCSYSGNVSANGSVGGLIGWNTCEEVDNCEMSGNVTGDTSAGGFTGVSAGNVTNSELSGTVSSKDNYMDKNGKPDYEKIAYGSAMIVHWYGISYIGDGPAILDWKSNNIHPKNINADSSKETEEETSETQEPETTSETPTISEDGTTADNSEMIFKARMTLGVNATQSKYPGIWVVKDPATGEEKFFTWDAASKSFSPKVFE